MPNIFDNIDNNFKEALSQTLEVSYKADFCVGYFNLRGWKSIDKNIEGWTGGDENCCRLLIGMQRLPQEELRIAESIITNDNNIDNQTALRFKTRIAEEFRDQLTIGVPSNADEKGLRRLVKQLKTKKLIVRLFLKHSLHAKLYLLFRNDTINPIIGYLGSSNLTQSGLSSQGELNVDILDNDACTKLSHWFDERWSDRWCIDISEELIKVIDESWARERPIPPYHIYIKMAYHIAQEARSGLNEFKIPKIFENELLDYQIAAVKIAAHHLNKRNGVMIGDVVGLGKTLMATALARIFEDDYDLEVLILCPKNLVKMWEDYRERYALRGKVISISTVINDLPETRRYRLVIIDESHNLRNRQGKRYKVIHDYINQNDSKCILLSATPYNKTYQDLSSQLRLFIPEDLDLNIRPENLLREIGQMAFSARYQADIRTIAAFEKSEYPDDWRELMRLFLVRRTRSFIKDNYGKFDDINNRKYLLFKDGITKQYFPNRIPKTVNFEVNTQYENLFSDDVVDKINNLELPRYGLGNYLDDQSTNLSNALEKEIIKDLSRSGKSVMGFCRTNLFKRLESGGYAYLVSIERHILRNFIFMYAIDNGLPLPLGQTDSSLIDKQTDQDQEFSTDMLDSDNTDDEDLVQEELTFALNKSEEDFLKKAEKVYNIYERRYPRRFRWIGTNLFTKKLRIDLYSDATFLRELLVKFGEWKAEEDTKLNALHKLVTKDHPDKKILIFSQFADTVEYLEKNLKKLGVEKIESASGKSSDPTKLAWRFSPTSNAKRSSILPEEEIRILIATDVLSEGQNLQDSHIVVNYDLPWAIIRLIQRAGRVDRIGQKSLDILCYSFLPADGINNIINLRGRVRNRLNQNAEVVGSDEAFFEDDDQKAVLDLYNEKTGILDDQDDSDVDLASYAFQIWQNAITEDPALKKKIEDMSSVVYSSKYYSPPKDNSRPEGALVYLKTSQGNETLTWISNEGNRVTENQFEILRAAKCSPETPAITRPDIHHDIVRKAAELVGNEETEIGGQLGRPSSVRYKIYHRLKNFSDENINTLFNTDLLKKSINDVYRFPLRTTAVNSLNRQLRSGIDDLTLSDLVISLRQTNRLCVIHEQEEVRDPEIICSMGLVKN